ncbi:unnamed protein product [Pleuronectes platessa]|uniref:Uncharacterized protein n=1 Tax=Pleuronectes platessa TaxID=8262 RepID=A0A9N7YUD5_PLEPL|nr:unnamed protein product [Pleuronectes platessa]
MVAGHPKDNAPPPFGMFYDRYLLTLMFRSSTQNLRLPYRSAPHPRLTLDLQASQHPAAPACICLSCQ